MAHTPQSISSPPRKATRREKAALKKAAHSYHDQDKVQDIILTATVPPVPVTLSTGGPVAVEST
eukprot:10574166-Karenia_brevis.AAC.1